MRHLDVALFYWINNGLSSERLDVFFRYVTNFRNFTIPIFIAAVFLEIKGKARGRFCILALAVCAGLTDNVSSQLIKHIVHRERPCVALPHVVTPDGIRRTYSFPSSHATNAAGAATVFSLEFPSAALPAAIIALLVGLSRVYLGLHYPSDVLAGFVLGGVIGWCVGQASRSIQRRLT